MRRLLFLLLAGAAFAPAEAANPILFVTQMPIASEANSRTVAQSQMSVASTFSNHLGDTVSAGRGGALWVLDPGATTPRNLTLAGGFGGSGQPLIAVRQPHVHWNGTKALFSMVVGSPSGPSDSTQFFWQLYEITGFGVGQTVQISRIPNQPANTNNISPAYGTDGRILFTSDRPRSGAPDVVPHLYPQREEYLLLPTNTGVWSLDRNTGDLRLVEHSPSGSFTPFVDSFGRLLFVRWDHLSRDPQATTDRGPGTGDTFAQTFNGTFNYADESASAAINSRLDLFPEPRNFDKSGLAGTNLNGNSFNQFTPWMVNEDGTGEETINHVGRQELYQGATKSYTNDTNLTDQNFVAPHTYVGNLFQLREDPRPAQAGLYYGINAGDVGYHGAGQIVRFDGKPSTNPGSMAITYVTAQVSVPPPPLTPLTTAANIYRQAVPLSNGSLLAVHTLARTTDGNALPAPPSGPGGVEAYLFRLKTMTGSVGSMTPGAALFATPLTANVTFWAGANQITFNGQLWELDPVEVVVRAQPATGAGASVSAIEQTVFSEEGVDLPTFQGFLRNNNLSLIVSRDVTTRDKADKQQPFQLKINSPTSTRQTPAASANPPGKVYGIAYLQLLQADQLRGFTNNTATPVPGRRVLATPMHDATALAEMPAVPNSPAPGSVKLGDDGSLAALVPARRAMTWHLLDTNGTSQVKERYWVTFQPGEVRTCTSCHGVNTVDQASQPPPTNKPQALRDLLRFWKSNHPPGTLQLASAAVSTLKNAGTVTLTVTRASGGTGPVSASYATADGTALNGQDYTATSGTLTWADGDTAPKPITIALSNNPVIAGDKTFTVTLGGSATLGGTTTETVTVQDP